MKYIYLVENNVFVGPMLNSEVTHAETILTYCRAEYHVLNDVLDLPKNLWCDYKTFLEQCTVHFMDNAHFYGAPIA